MPGVPVRRRSSRSSSCGSRCAPRGSRKGPPGRDGPPCNPSRGRRRVLGLPSKTPRSGSASWPPWRLLSRPERIPAKCFAPGRAGRRRHRAQAMGTECRGGLGDREHQGNGVRLPGLGACAVLIAPEVDTGVPLRLRATEAPSSPRVLKFSINASRTGKSENLGCPECAPGLAGCRWCPRCALPRGASVGVQSTCCARVFPASFSLIAPRRWGSGALPLPGPVPQRARCLGLPRGTFSGAVDR